MRAWEPMEGELRGQGKAWRAFQTFRDMPERSLRGAATLFYGCGERGPTRSQYEQFKRWSARFAWQERVQGFDSWVAMTQRAAIEEHARAEAEEHAQREVALREKALRLRELAAHQAEKMLEWPLVKQTVVQENERGEPIELVFQSARWSKETAVRLYGVAFGNDPHSDDGEAEGNLDYSELTTDELRTLVALRRKVQVRRPEPKRP